MSRWCSSEGFATKLCAGRGRFGPEGNSAVPGVVLGWGWASRPTRVDDTTEPYGGQEKAGDGRMPAGCRNERQGEETITMSTAGYWRTGLQHATPRAAGEGGIAYSSGTKRENGPMDFLRSRGGCNEVMKGILGVRNPQSAIRSLRLRSESLALPLLLAAQFALPRKRRG
jgi:hypothetical protein